MNKFLHGKLCTCNWKQKKKEGILKRIPKPLHGRNASHSFTELTKFIAYVTTHAQAIVLFSWIGSTVLSIGSTNKF